MWTYLLAALVVFGVNLLPAFGPPTWSVLVLFRLNSHLNAVALIAMGAAAAAAGRYVLAAGTSRFAGRLSAERTANLAEAKAAMTAGRGRTVLGLTLFALSPLPSAQLFEAAGLMRVRLWPLVSVFFAGRLVSYTIYVTGATALRHTNVLKLVGSSFTSPAGIALQLGMLAAVVALARLNWIGIIRNPSRLLAHATTALLVLETVGIATGGALRWAGELSAAATAWETTTVLGALPCAWWVIDAARHRRIGADLIALLALVGTLVVGEHLAGAVVAVMLASGRFLEGWAAARSTRELSALLDRAPRTAHRYWRDGAAGDGALKVADVAVDDVVVGDLLVVKPGEVVPVDGRVEAGIAVVDEAALTGEAVPVERAAGEEVRSGVVNAGSPFDLRVTTPAAESTYAGIVALVKSAEASTAPAVRLADRYAGWFLAVSLSVAGAAWGFSGSAARAVGVLVVATPCPLILAVPVALISGLSRAARRGTVIKGGAVLEQLAKATVLLFDKTGTLTAGRPTLADIVVADPDVTPAEILRLAASVDQLSPHVLAAAVVRAARQRDLALDLPEEVHETPGQGVRGWIAGHQIAVGKAGWAAAAGDPSWLRGVRRRAERDGMVAVYVAVDERLAGALLLEDPVRPDAARTIRRLRRDGIRRVVMVTGDRAEVADSVGAVIGVDEVLAERTPAEKVDAVIMSRRVGVTIMVGDGINDAPALALADIGVAIGARGATASSEAADVVLMVDRLDRLGEAVVTARRALTIATQSVVGGIGLSLVAMALAAVGLLPATWGAIAQEAIDVGAILNALRVLGGSTDDARLEDADAELARRFTAEHAELRADIEQLRTAADVIGVVPAAEAVRVAREAHLLLINEIGPHEAAEDAELYPVLARLLGGQDPTGTTTRAHIEIAHLISRLGRLLDGMEATGPDNEDLLELRRLLYGLHAILRLHNAQEDENYLSLADEPRLAHEGR